MLQVSENRIMLNNFEQNIGLALNKINNCTQNAPFESTSGSQPESIPIKMCEPETALDLSVADKKLVPGIVGDIEATKSNPWQQYQLASNANVRKLRLLQASPAQTTPLYGLSPKTTSHSSQNLILNRPSSASLWPVALESEAVRKINQYCDILMNPDKKIRLEAPDDSKRRFSAPIGPAYSTYGSASAASLAPSPAKSDGASSNYCHQYEALSQRLPRFHQNEFSLFAASSYGRPNNQLDPVGISPDLARFNQPVGSQNRSPSLQFDDRLQPTSFQFMLGQQPQGANALNSSSRDASIMRQQLPVGEQNMLQSSAMNHLNNLDTTLELVQAKIGKDHKLIPILRKMSFRCHVCGSCFEDRHRLQQHLSIHLQLHPSWFEERTIKDTMAKYESRRGDYLCTICHLRHDTTAEFDKHMQLHSERPHQCELCLKDNKTVAFRFFRQLLTHMRSHCFIYNCRFASDCKQTANRKDYLKLHILKHHLNNKLSDKHTMAAHNIDNLSGQGFDDRMVR